MDNVIEVSKSTDQALDGCCFNIKFTKIRQRVKEPKLIEKQELKFQCIDGDKYEWVFTEAPKKIDEKVCKLLSEGKTQEAIAQELDLSQTRVSRIKSKLKKKGYLKNGTLTGKGEKFIKSLYEADE